MTDEYELPTTDRLDSRQFLIAIRRLADSLAYGTDRSPFVGSGIEYAQSRLYQPGDPVKAIDWRVTARTRKYHVKEYESPKRLPVYLLVDTSASMTVSSVPTSKYARAVQIAGGIALACLDRMNPVAVLAVGERSLRCPPSLSRDRVMQWLHILRRYRLTERTQLARRLLDLEPTLMQRSLLITLSDLNDPAALGPLKQVAQRHDCVVLQFQDPAECSLHGVGLVRGQEAETGVEFITRGKQLGIDQQRWTSELRHGKVDHLLMRTDQPFEHRLRYFFKSRGLVGRQAR